MMRAVFLFILIIIMGQTAGAQTVINKEQSILTIDILENGNVLWSEEQYYPLTSQSAISEWKLRLKGISDVSNVSNVSGVSNASNVISNVSNVSNVSNAISAINISTKKSTEINERINRSLLSAMNYSNRSMSIQNFNITYDLVDEKSNAYGVIRWNFEWVNFSQIEGSNIIIGDAFSDRVVPSIDNVLIMNIPEGYEVVNASPRFDKSDGNKLIWDGTMYRSFSKGEPSLLISRQQLSQDSFPVEIVTLLVIVILIVIASSGLFLFWKRVANSRKKEDLMKDALKAEGINDEAVQTGAEYSGSMKDLPSITEDILGDEEMIERYLIKCGGQAYQTDIVKDSGLSKSKISIVLAKMKDEGRIIKIRKGKENIIRIVTIQKE